MRLLVTGSRNWKDEARVKSALTWAAALAEDDKPLILVHGDCPSGADRIANDFIQAIIDDGNTDLFRIEKHPADWSLGAQAGPTRNKYMVDLGADICLAFIEPCSKSDCRRKKPHGSHGASGTADLAEAAGIQTWRIEPIDIPPAV